MNSVPKQKAIEILNELLEQLGGLEGSSSDSLEFQKWRRDTEIAIKHVFVKDDDNLKRFTANRYTPALFGAGTDNSSYDREAFEQGVVRAKALLQAMITEIERFWD